KALADPIGRRGLLRGLYARDAPPDSCSLAALRRGIGLFCGIIEAQLNPGAPYGTQRNVQETPIKWALLRLSAERVIPPRCTTGNLEAACEDAVERTPLAEAQLLVLYGGQGETYLSLSLPLPMLSWP